MPPQQTAIAANTLKNYCLSLRWTTALLFLLLPLQVPASAHKSDAWAHGQFAVAEHKRQVLNELPPDQQTRHEYQDVIDSYRRVYYGCPTSSKADASVSTVANLLAEMGRHFHEDRLLSSAIAQYEFLRREYPGSKYRVEALFNIGHIYRDDLNDATRAQQTFDELIKQYPRNPLADDARASLANPTEALRKTKEDESANRTQTDLKNAETTDAKDTSLQ